VSFDLLTNPFAVLELAGDASVGKITARARALGTTAATSASRTLLSPRTRLLAELTFLLDAPEDMVGICIGDLRAGRGPQLLKLDLTPPARANLLAHLASEGAANAHQLRDLVTLQEEILSSAGGIVDRSRENAGMPPVPREMLDTTLGNVSSQHAEAYAQGMLAIPGGAELFAEQLCATAHDATTRISFLRQSAAAWDRATASDVAQDLETSSRIEATLRDNPNPEVAAHLAELVLHFAGRTRPGREASRLVGLPHKTSNDAAERWRSVALDLNNRLDAVREAVTVLEALVTGFGSKDELGARTAMDLDTCRKRIASGSGTPEIRCLTAAIEAAVEKELAFQRSAMPDGRTTAQTPAVVADLHDAFVAAARAARSDLPWRLLRSFTLRLHNEFSATEAALSFTQLAMQEGKDVTFAADTIHQLWLDLRTLRKEVMTIKLTTAVSANQTSVARQLLAQLVNQTDDNKERAGYQAALRKLERQQKVARLKYGVIALLGVLVLFFAISNESTAPTHSNPPALKPPLPFDPDAGHPERQPTAATAVLTRSELRWCRYEGARARAALEYLRSIHMQAGTIAARYNASVQAYNAFIAPINASCVNVRYLRADGQVIDAEMSQNDRRLKAEGEHLIAVAYETAAISQAQVPNDSTPAPYMPPPSDTSSTGAAPPSPQATIENSSAYEQGRADRQNWELWFNGLSGAFRDGADWWAGVRSLASPPSCNRARGVDHAAVVAGCVAAQARLSNSERRRRAEPDYRAGWNNP
jgi:hypothetical protein